MARARNIKPSFFMNEELVELPFETRLLFIGLWTLADRDGRLEDRPKRIKMEVFPADNIDIDKCLSDLECSDLIERYEADGKKIILVTNFTKHQRPHHTEKDSVLPDKDGNYSSDNGGLTVKQPLNNEEDQEQDGENPPDSLNPDSLIPDLLNDESVDESPPNKKQKRRSQIPKNLEPTKEMVRFAVDRDFDYMTEFELFKNYHISKQTLSGDWSANWRTWVLRGRKYDDEKKAQAQARASPQGKQAAVEQRNAQLMQELLDEGMPNG